MDKKPFRNIRQEKNGITYLGDCSSFVDFEKSYLSARLKEGRVFEDSQVSQLPWLPKSHRLHAEWLLRADTLKRFQKYIQKKTGVTSLLDLGCGNGWFINRLSEVRPQTNFYGLEVNTRELEQAARLFVSGNICFAYGDLFQDILEPCFFDIIVLNSTAQYFPDLHRLLARLFELLKPGGEIHILDSPFYNNEAERSAARERSKDYFTKLGIAGMASQYHHHNLGWLNNQNYKVFYDPGSLKIKMLRIAGAKRSPFRWICIEDDI